MNKNRLKKCLCFIADDNFIDGAKVLLYSFLINEPESKKFAKICFYDNTISVLSTSNKVLLKSLCDDLIFKEISNESYRKFPVKFPSHNISLLKYECFKLHDYDYIFYIDTDILILKPISGLIEHLDNSDYNILCVENKSRSWEFRTYQFSAFSANTGFFLLKCKNKNYLDIIYKELIEEIHHVTSLSITHEMVCQPIFNKVMSSFNLSYLAAPIGFNFRNLSEFDKYNSLISIIHYVSRTYNDNSKPWDLDLGKNIDENFAISTWETYRIKINELIKP